MNTQQMVIPCVSNNGSDMSFFSSRSIDLHGSQVRMLSEQQAAVNFRLRSSDSSYASDWHVAGDPTLLLILRGTVRIILRNGEFRDFTNGDMFIAEDFLLPDISFNDDVHGHRAEVVGDKALEVLHLKLEKR